MDEKKEDRSEESKKNHMKYYKSLTKIITNMNNEINEEGEPAIKEHLTSRIDAMEKDRKKEIMVIDKILKNVIKF